MRNYKNQEKMQQHLKLGVVITTRCLFCFEHQLGAITIDKKIIEKKSLNFLINPIMSFLDVKKSLHPMTIKP